MSKLEKFYKWFHITYIVMLMVAMFFAAVSENLWLLLFCGFLYLGEVVREVRDIIIDTMGE